MEPTKPGDWTGASEFTSSVDEIHSRSGQAPFTSTGASLLRPVEVFGGPPATAAKPGAGHVWILHMELPGCNRMELKTSWVE